MNRAVTIEVADIGGPNHGIFCARRARARSAAASAARARVPAGEQVGRRERRELEGGGVDEARSGSAHRRPGPARPTAPCRRGRRAAQHRGLVGPEQVGDLGGDAPARRPGWRCAHAGVVEVGDDRAQRGRPRR